MVSMSNPRNSSPPIVGPQQPSLVRFPHSFTPGALHHDPNQLDEGFSEEARTPTDSDMVYSGTGELAGPRGAHHVLSTILQMPMEHQKCECRGPLSGSARTRCRDEVQYGRRH